MSDDTKTYKEIDVSSFHYQEPRRNSNGGMNLYINENENSKTSPIFQLEQMVAKFGTNAPQEGSQSTRRNMECAVTSKELLEFIRRLDEQNIQEVAKNSQLYFKKEMSQEVLAQTLYRWSAAPHEKYDPLLRIKIATEGRNPTKVYRVVSQEGQELQCEDGNWEDIEAWSKVVPIVQVGGLWFVSRQFGMTLIAKAVLVWPSEKKAQNNFAGYNISTKPILSVETNAANIEVEMETAGEMETEEDIV